MKNKIRLIISLLKNKLTKLIVSLILIILAFLCFYFPKKYIQATTYKIANEKVFTIEEDGTKQYFNYIGLFFLVIALWLWRREFEFNQLAFLGAPPIEPTDPNSYGGAKDDLTTKKSDETVKSKLYTITSDEEELAKFKDQENIKRILEYLQSRPGSLTNVTTLTQILNLPSDKVELYLYKLTKEKLVRRDTYPGTRKSIFSLTSSIENKAIDFYIKNDIKTDILSDNRFVRINKIHEVDAIIRTSELYYIVEVKKQKVINKALLDIAVRQLLQIEEIINFSPLKLILLIITTQPTDNSIINEYTNFENLIVKFINIENSYYA